MKKSKQWKIEEHKKKVKAVLPTLRIDVRKKYEMWKEIIFKEGPEGLRNFPSLHDEALSGKRKGQRSSRLSKKYRVIYELDKDIVTVYVIEVTPHKY